MFALTEFDNKGVVTELVFNLLLDVFNECFESFRGELVFDEIMLAEIVVELFGLSFVESNALI